MRQLKITKSITNRDSASLEKYLHEISRFMLIDAEREIFLTRIIKLGPIKSDGKVNVGYDKAFEEMVNANLRFVVSVAKQYQNQGLSLPDLINEGNLGLIKAAQRFDETRGFKFISYAVWWIRQGILQALAEQARIVRIPLNKIGARNKVNKMSQKLEQEFQREPTIEEIAEITQLPIDDVKAAISNNLKHSSMDFQPGAEEGEATNMYEIMEDKEVAKPDGALMTTALKEEIKRALDKISQREADIIRLFFGLNPGQEHGLTLEEIGDMFSLTRERVRQIKEKAIRRLKHSSRSKLLKAYLG